MDQVYPKYFNIADHGGGYARFVLYRVQKRGNSGNMLNIK